MPDSTLLDGRPSPGTTPVLIGTIIGKKYRVDRLLGKGGMGVVLAATHVALEERVAIKMLHSSLVRDQDAVRRFTIEARAVRKLTSEHVVRVRDVDTFPDGVPYIVMDLLEGEDLAARMNRERPAIGTAVGWIVAACEAIAEAHAQKIVHRDLKPANLFLAKTSVGETLKVLDFGVAKILEASARDQADTATNVAIGTPAYMAPEQHESAKGADARCDVWALGAVLYHLLVGRVPFQGETPQVTYALILSTVPKAPHALAPEIPAALSDAVMRCLQKKTAARFQRVEDLRDAIAPFANIATRANVITELQEPAREPAREQTAVLAQRAQEQPAREQAPPREPFARSESSAAILVEGTLRSPSSIRARAPRTRIIVVALALSLTALAVLVAPASLFDRGPRVMAPKVEPASKNGGALLDDPSSRESTGDGRLGASHGASDGTGITSASAPDPSSEPSHDLASASRDSSHRSSLPASSALASHRASSSPSAHATDKLAGKPAPVSSGAPSTPGAPAAASASGADLDDLYRHRQSF